MKASIPVVWKNRVWQERLWRKGALPWLGSVALAVLTLTPAGAAERPTLLVMGDSLSAAYNIEQDAGWVHLLSERLGENAKVVNASISGETSSGAAERFPQLISEHSPGVVVIELGGNDGLRGLPPGELYANLARMIEQSQAADATVLLLGIDIPPNYGQAYREAFTAVYPRLAATYHVALVPFLLDGIALDDALMQSDGIHPVAEAQPAVLDNVWPVLGPLLAPLPQINVTSSGVAAAQARPE
jgi:acyl-CoA thioesterase-1